MTASSLSTRVTGMRRPRSLGSVCLGGAVLLTAAVGHGQTSDPPGAPGMGRLVYRFDFDERDEGNFESLPMHWRKVGGEGFPRFSEGGFDPEVGRSAPPSFHIQTNGRNAAYWYAGEGVAVRPNSAYLVVGYVRPDLLISSRACLSAYYLDRQQLPIAGTQVFSCLVGEDSAAEAWQRVEMHLPPAPASAQCIGLTAWVVQASVWDRRTRPHRHLELPDVGGGAWFDDITVYRMPSVTLTTASLANIFVAPEEPTLQITVADIDAVGMEAFLAVRSAAGNLVYDDKVPVQTTEHVQAIPLRLAGLEPGLYEAALSIQAGPDTTLTRRLRFARLAPLVNPGAGVARHFGMALDADVPLDPPVARTMLAALGVGAVKIPVWGQSTLPALAAADGGASDELLNDLVNARVSLTGVFGAPPAELIESAGSFARPLLAILSDDPAGWRSQLTAVVASYASVFRVWQVGADGDLAVVGDPALVPALRNLRDEMVPLINTVYLSAPGDIGTVTQGTFPPAEELTLLISRDVHHEWIASYLEQRRDLDYQWLSAYVETGPAETYRRLPFLADFAKRIIRTRHAGVGTTYVPQLWHSRPTMTGPVTEPTEQYIAYRTIIDLLGDLAPGPETSVAAGVEAIPFHDVNTSVLVLWDPEAPPEGSVYELQLGSARRQIDLWGRATPLPPTADGRQEVRVFAEPTFVEGVDRWVLDFIAGMGISPDEAELSLIPMTHTVRLRNSGSRQLAGRVLLQTPSSWEVKPREFGFRLSPQSTLEQPVEIRYSHNEPAGTKRFDAVIDFDTEPKLHLEVPLALQLGIKDVDVWAFALLEGDRLVLRHGITNRSARPLNFRSFATVPGRSRQCRVVASLAPAATTTTEYRFDNAAALSGRTVRLDLHEVDGPRSHSTELVAP